MGFVLDDLCVFLGVIIVWLFKGRRYSLWEELREVRVMDFWSRKEGVIGLAGMVAFIGTIWAIRRLL